MFLKFRHWSFLFIYNCFIQFCTGSSASCPPDSLQPSGTVKTNYIFINQFIPKKKLNYKHIRFAVLQQDLVIQLKHAADSHHSVLSTRVKRSAICRISPVHVHFIFKTMQSIFKFYAIQQKLRLIRVCWCMCWCQWLCVYCVAWFQCVLLFGCEGNVLKDQMQL